MRLEKSEGEWTLAGGVDLEVREGGIRRMATHAYNDKRHFKVSKVAQMEWITMYKYATTTKSEKNCKKKQQQAETK